MSEPTVDDIASRGLEDLYSQVTSLAEAALLGGLLLRREALGSVRPWLSPDHFQSPTNAAIYQTLLESPSGEEDDDPARGLLEVAERTTAPGATPAYVQGLIDSRLRTDHLAHYGRLVVRQAVRRTAAEEGIRLSQRAATLDTSDPAAVQDLVAWTERARRMAADLAAKTTLTADVLSDQGRPADPQEPQSEEEVAAARLRGGSAAVPTTEAMAREIGLVAAVIRHPDQLDGPEVRELTPQSFTDRTCGALFVAAVALHERGELLDELLVVAEADTVRPWREGFGPIEARDALADSVGSAPHFAKQILAHRAQDAARRAADDLQAAAIGSPVAVASQAAAQDIGAAGRPTPHDGGPQAPSRPVVVFVLGSDPVTIGTVSVLVSDALAHRGQPPVVLGRAFPPDHPLHALVTGSGATTPLDRFRVAEQHLLTAGHDVIVHAGGNNPEALAEEMRRFQAAGFRVELAAVPTSGPQRRLSALDAHLQCGRSGPPPPTPDYRLVDSLALVERERLAQTVSVLSPDGRAIFTNHLLPSQGGRGRWQHDAHASRWAAHEADRPWTADESARFAAAHARVIAQAGPEHTRALQAIATEAAALHVGESWRTGVDLAAQAVAPPPERNSRADERMRAAGPVTTLTDAQLEYDLVQTLRNHEQARTSAQRVADRAGKAQAVVDGGGGPVVDRLRAAGVESEVIARAVLAATEDAAYLAQQAQRGQRQVQLLEQRASVVLTEINRRAQLTHEQRRQEDQIRHGRREAWSRHAVHDVQQRSRRSAPPVAASVPASPVRRGARS